MSYVSSIELRKVRPEAVKYVAHACAFDSRHHRAASFLSEKSVLESVVDLLHDVVEKVPQVRVHLTLEKVDRFASV